jgi:TRAP-type C4-dicarboxylate transport system substrate-binding protein
MSASAATKWDMPTPYGDGVHHTKNVKVFTENVNKATSGELNIIVHAGTALYKHPEISLKRRYYHHKNSRWRWVW